MKEQRVHIVIEVIFSKRATDALIKQALYIFEQTKNPDIADRHLDKIEEFIVSMLSTFPKAGRVADEFGENIRKLVYQHYSILYKIIDDKHIVVIFIYRENLPKI